MHLKVVKKKCKTAGCKGKCGQSINSHMADKTITRKLLNLGGSSVNASFMALFHLTCRGFLIKGRAKSNTTGFSSTLDKNM